MKRIAAPFTALVLLASTAAHAASTTTGTLSVVIQAPLAIVFSPASPTIPCGTPAGTVVASMTVTGGDGNPVSYTLTGGDTADFAVSGANIVVASAGIASGACTGKPTSLTVTATQS